MREIHRFLAIISVIILSASVTGAAPKSGNKHAGKLLSPLIGQKCTVVLRSNESQVGTLWDFGEDFLTLKVKKGLLYSKAEKFKLADVKYLEDEKGKRIDISTLPLQKKTDQQAEPAQEQTTGLTEKPPMTLYIGSAKPEESQAEPETKAVAAVASSRTTSANSSSGAEPARVKTAQAKQEKQQGYSYALQSKTSAIEAGGTRVQKPATKRDPKQTRAAQSSAKKQSAHKEKTPKAKVQDPVATVAATKVIAPVAPVTTPAPAVSSEVKTLRYQRAIFFGVIAFIFAAIVFFNLAGLRGKVTDKQLLFPVKLIKIEGNYGVIDQGTNEGIRVNDIVRLHARLGRQIPYKGKVRVKKVNRTFAAVEVIRKKRQFDLEIGDVGFRDRNVIGNAFEKTRVATSIVLSGIAKILAITSRTIEIKKSEPDIDLDRVTLVDDDALLERAELHLTHLRNRTRAQISDGSSSQSTPERTKNI